MFFGCDKCYSVFLLLTTMLSLHLPRISLAHNYFESHILLPGFRRGNCVMSDLHPTRSGL